jgi:hypothetical protein
MLKRIKQLFAQYREYIRVDLAMYAVLLLLILAYFVLSVLGFI